MVKEISSQVPIHSDYSCGLPHGMRASTQQSQEVLSSMKAGNDNGLGTKIWSMTRKVWNGIYGMFQTLLGWMFCQCFCSEKKVGKDLMVELDLLKSPISIDEKVEIFNELPKEIRACVQKICPRPTTEIVEKYVTKLIEPAIKVHHKLPKQIKEVENLINQAGSEEQNRSLTNQSTPIVQGMILTNDGVFKPKEFKERLEECLKELNKELEKLEHNLDEYEKYPGSYGINV